MQTTLFEPDYRTHKKIPKQIAGGFIMTPTNEERMNAIVTRMPLVVLQDVEKRITDWLSHGGSSDL